MINQGSVFALLKQAAYFSLRAFLCLVQMVLHNLNGTAAYRKKINEGTTNSDKIVEVSRVLMSIPDAGLSISGYSNLCCWHERFVSLNYLLNPSISLYFFDSTHAFFVETLPGTNICNTREFPFYPIAQRIKAVRTVVIPVEDLKKLANMIGEPTCQVGWVFHMARCGSTAVAQSLNAIPNCTVFSESQAILAHLISVLSLPGVVFDDYVNSPGFYSLQSAAVIFQLKDFGKNDTVCMKTASTLHYIRLPLIAKRFPSHKFISLYRDGPSSLNSFVRMMGNHLGMAIGLKIWVKFPKLFNSWIRWLPIIFSNGLLSEVEHFYGKDVNMAVFLFINWVTNIVAFQRCTQSLQKGQLLPVYHDDFQADKEATMAKILQIFGISADHLPHAMEGLQEDSQKGSHISREILKNRRGFVRDEHTVQVFNNVLSQFNLPSFDQKFRFNADYEIEIM